MKTDFLFTLLSDMKRFIALFLALLMLCLVSLSSCFGGDGEWLDSYEEENDSETEKQFQSFDELEHKSDDKFALDEIITFTHSGGKTPIEKNSIFFIGDNGDGGIRPFKSLDTLIEYKNISGPFGVDIGDSITDVAESLSIDTGYAALVKIGGSYHMYDEKEGIDMSGGKGGCLYLGYAQDPSGEWAFMDYEMLTATLRGQLIIKGATEDYNVVVVSCTVDANQNLKHLSILYGELNAVMTLVSN